MIKQAAVLGLAGALAISSGVAQAAADDKMFSVGGALYWIDIEATGIGDLEFSGGALVGTAAFNENVAVRGSIYNTKWDDDSALKLSGYDTQLLLGSNLKSEGFKFYAAIGVFSESMTVSGVRGDMDFNGGQFGVGLGYNWPSVSLDYSINVRSADDYADFVEQSGLMQLAGVTRSEVSAVSSSLALAVRF